MENVFGGIIFFSPIWLGIIGYLIFRKPGQRYLARKMRKQYKEAIRNGLREQRYLDQLAQEVAEEEGL